MILTNATIPLRKQGLNLWPANTCLLTHLAEQIYMTHLEHTWRDGSVILPTGRLGTWLLAALAGKARKVVEPPLVTTLESWIHLHSKYRSSQKRTITDLEQTNLIASLIHNTGYGYLKPGQEHELTLVFNEMDQAGLSADAFATLESYLTSFLPRSENYTNSLVQRVEEIRDCYVRFHTTLQKMDVETGAQHQRSNVAFILENISDMKNQQFIYLAGFTSVVPIVVPLLQRLLELPQCQIWLTKSPDLLSKSNPLNELCAALNANDHMLVATTDTITGHATVTMASHRSEEVEAGFAICQQAIAHGIPPSRTALLVSQESDYADLIRSHVSRHAIDANIALASNIMMTPLGSWLADLYQVLTQRTVANFFRWVGHPLSVSWLAESQAIDQAEVLQQCAEWLRDHASELTWDLNKWRPKIPQDAIIQRSLGLIAQLCARTKYSWAECASKFNDAVAAPLSLLRDRGVLDPVSSEAFSLLEQFLQRTMRLFATIETEPCTLVSFFQTIRRSLSKLEMRSLGEPLHGIQVLSLPESRYFPFDCVVLIGTSEGLFPKRMPQDELLDDFSKRLMGLPGWQALEAREDLSFSLLKARIPNFFMTYPVTKIAEEVIPSRYVELLLANGEATSVPYKAPKMPCFPSPLSPDKHEGRLHCHPDLFTEFSASSLEALITCPYRFLLQKQGLRKHPLPMPWFDAREEGEWLHEVLEVFMRDHGGVFAHRSKTDNLALLEKLCKDLGPSGIEGKGIFHHLMQFSFPKFLVHMEKLFAEDGIERLSGGKRELFFGKRSAKASFPITKQLRTGLVGKIDSIDFLDGLTVIVDYKRKAIPKKLAGANPQLSFYALALSHLDTDDLRTQVSGMLTGYWSILDAKWQGGACGAEAFQKAQRLGLISSRGERLESAIEALIGLWRWRLDEIQHAEVPFRADPSDCRLCDYSGMCRKLDALHEERLRNQRSLKFRHLEPSEDPRELV